MATYQYLLSTPSGTAHEDLQVELLDETGTPLLAKIPATNGLWELVDPAWGTKDVQLRVLDLKDSEIARSPVLREVNTQKDLSDLFDFIFPLPRVLRATVRDEEGAPIPRARVKVVRLGLTAASQTDFIPERYTDLAGNWATPALGVHAPSTLQVVVSDDDGNEIGRGPVLRGQTGQTWVDGTLDVVVPRKLSLDPTDSRRMVRDTVARVVGTTPLNSITKDGLRFLADEASGTVNQVRQAAKGYKAYRNLATSPDVSANVTHEQLDVVGRTNLTFTTLVSPHPVARNEQLEHLDPDVDFTTLQQALWEVGKSKLFDSGSRLGIGLQYLSANESDPGHADGWIPLLLQNPSTIGAIGQTPIQLIQSLIANGDVTTASERRAAVYVLLASLFSSEAAIDVAYAQLGSSTDPSDLLASEADVEAVADALRGAASTDHDEHYLEVLRTLQAAYPERAYALAIEATGAFESAGVPSTVTTLLRSMPADRLFKVDLSAIADVDIREAVAALKRLDGLAGKPGAMDLVSSLWEAGVRSSADVLTTDRSAFATITETTHFTTADVDRVYRRAEARQAIAVHLWLALATAGGGRTAALGLDSEPTYPAFIAELVTGDDGGQCEHCASVLSPGAYLGELVAWVKARGLFSSTTGDPNPEASAYLDDLRPDIKDTTPTCAHTHDPVPTIARVLEILDAKMGYAGQGGISDDALADIRGDNPFPLMPRIELPFDLLAYEAKQWLVRASADPFPLATLIGHANAHAAGVGTSSTLYGALSADAATLTTDELWGYDASATTDWRVQLSALPEFLKRSGLTSTDLDDLLVSYVGADIVMDTDVTNPTGPEDWFLTEPTSDGNSLTEATLRELVRTLRVAHLFDMDWRDVDLYVYALPDAIETVSTLNALVELKHLSERLELPATTLVGLLDTVDVRAFGGLGWFGTRFANSALDIDSGAETFDPTDIDWPANVAPSTVSSGLAFTFAESQDDIIDTLGTGDVSVETLGQLVVKSAVASRQSRTLGDLQALLAHADADPFGLAALSDRPAALRRWLDEVALHDSGPWADNQLGTLLAGESFADGLSLDGALGRVAQTEGVAELWLQIYPTPPSDQALTAHLPLWGTPTSWSAYTAWRSLVELIRYGEAVAQRSVDDLLSNLQSSTANAVLVALGLAPDTDIGLRLAARGFDAAHPRFWWDYVRVASQAPVPQLGGWLDDMSTSLEDIRQHSVSQLDTSEGFQAMEQQTEAFLERARDAMVTYLVGDDVLDDSGDLLPQLLIDVHASGCATTTRVLEASLAVQQFIHQEFRNGTALSEADAATWQWLKNYRMWEVSRKLILWPENWMRPELRKGKSEAFERFEQEVLDGDGQLPSIAQAIRQYAQEIDSLSTSRVIAICTQSDDSGETTHLFARPLGEETTLLYRQWRDRSWFSAWETLPFKVSATHLLPVVTDGQLTLYWADFQEGSTSDSQFWRISLSCSDQVGDRWSPPRTEMNDMSLEGVVAHAEPRDNYFLLAEAGDELNVHVHCQLYGDPEGLELVSKRAVQLRAEIRRHRQNIERYPLRDSAVVDLWTDQLLAAEGSLAEEEERLRDVSIGRGSTPRVGSFTVSPCSGRARALAKYESMELPAPPTAKFGRQRWVYRLEQPNTQMVRPGTLPVRPDPIVYRPSRVVEVNAGPYSEREGRFLEDQAPDVLFTANTDDVSVVFSHTRPHFGGSDPFVIIEGDRSYIVDPNWKDVPTPKVSVDGQPGRDDSTEGELAILQDSEADVSGDLAPSNATYRLALLSHPYACAAVRRIAQSGPFGLLNPPTVGFDNDDWTRQTQTDDFFLSRDPQVNIADPLPADRIDFAPSTSMALYNWELFYFAPLYIAQNLASRDQHEDAHDWYRTVFDPLDRTNVPSESQRFFKVGPLATATTSSYESLALKLADGSLDDAEVESLMAELTVVARNPFDPHAIGMARPVAMRKAAVAKYLTHLIAWADDLYRLETREALNEALGLYLVAEQLLGAADSAAGGTEPEPPTVGEAAETMGDRVTAMEALLHPDVSGLPRNLAAVQSRPLPLSIAMSGFCIPENDHLHTLRQQVADRLFKLRNCQSIDGEVRALDFFEPPLDPFSILRNGGASGSFGVVKAPAGSIYRYAHLLPRARQAAELARSLSQSVLSALSSQDAMALQELRNRHQLAIAEMQLDAKRWAADQARRRLDALTQQRKSAVRRRAYYERQLELGVRREEDRALNMRRDASYVDIYAGHLSGTAGLVSAAGKFQAGPTGTSWHTGPEYVGAALQMASQEVRSISTYLRARSDVLTTRMGWQRRAEDWKLQKNLASDDIERLDLELAAAQLQVQAADRDYLVQQRLIRHATEEERYYQTNFATSDLHAWLSERAHSLSKAAYLEAVKATNRALQAFQTEIGESATVGAAIPVGADLDVQHWDPSRKGLMAAEKLLVTLSQLDNEYVAAHDRRHELTKHVSLMMLDSAKVFELQTVGTCSFEVPEAVFDLDFPMHTNRRIRSVTLTLPCTTGRYEQASATLSRGSTSVALSSGQNDGGVFRMSLDDSRYLPFEYEPVAGTFTVTLSGATGEARQWATFDWSTITDVVLTIQYEAQDGGQADYTALTNWLQVADTVPTLPRVVAASMREHSPDSWHRMVQQQQAYTNRFGLRFAAATVANSTYYEVPNAPDVGLVTLTHDWTIAFWARSNTNDLAYHLVKRTGTNHGYIIYQPPGTTDIHFDIRASGTRYQMTWAGKPHGTWSHLAFVHTGGTVADGDNLTLFVDGQPTTLKSEAVFNAGGALTSGESYQGAPLTLGGSPGVATSGGIDLDELVIYEAQALSQAEVETLIDASNGATPPAAAPYVGAPDHYWSLGDSPTDRSTANEVSPGVLRPNTLVDEIGEAHFAVTAESQANNTATILEHPASITTQPLDLVVPMSDAQLPYIVQAIRAQKTNVPSAPSERYALQASTAELWLIFETEEAREAYESLNALPTAYAGTPGSQTSLTLDASSKTGGPALVWEVSGDATADELRDVHLHFDDAVAGLVDIVAVANWGIDFPTDSSWNPTTTA